ncbi:MAG: hypothetical protein R3C27_05885 [Hyphomonadaceae bacterium]
MGTLHMRTFAIAFVALFALASPAFAACDLTPTIGAPAEKREGQQIMITLEVANRGDTNCPGTIEAPPGASYMVDIFLSTDRVGPSTWAVYNATWREDVLLRGGRVSRTNSVGPGASVRYGAPSYEISPMTLPTGIPPEDYFLSAPASTCGAIAWQIEQLQQRRLQSAAHCAGAPPLIHAAACRNSVANPG